jgi:hypothetical protein
MSNPFGASWLTGPSDMGAQLKDTGRRLAAPSGPRVMCVKLRAGRRRSKPAAGCRGCTIAVLEVTPRRYSLCCSDWLHLNHLLLLRIV